MFQEVGLIMIHVVHTLTSFLQKEKMRQAKNLISDE